MEFKNDLLFPRGVRSALALTLVAISLGISTCVAHDDVILSGQQVYLESTCQTLTTNSITLAPPLTDSIVDARNSLRVDRLPNPAIAKSNLESAIYRLQNFLMSANDDRITRWLVFLRWNELQKELAKAIPDTETLVQLERNMRQNYPGLEMPIFSDVRLQLKNYIQAVRFGTEPENSIQSLSKRLDKLAESVQTPPTGSDLERQREIGFVLSLLEQTGQSPALIQSLRNGFSRPNFRLLASRDFIQRQFVRPVSQSNPVNENILGTQICGKGYLTGQVTPTLLNSPKQAALQLTLAANFASQNIGVNRGIRFHTRGNANIAASESVMLTDNGLVTSNDTTVDAKLQSDITGIDHRSRIVRKIANKKAAEQKPQAEAIGRSRLIGRVTKQFHEQLSEQMSETNSQIRMPEFPIFKRLGLEKPKRTSWSSSDYLSLLWKQQGPAQLAAPSSCPLVVPTQGVTIQIHQSAIINAIDPIISGRILRSVDLDDMASQFGMEPSQALRDEAGGEPWSISMAGFHPAEIEFDNQAITFRIRTTKLDRGDRALEQSASIEASYRPIVEDGAIQMKRTGDVKIDFVGKSQGGLRAVTMRSFLKKKFDSVFKQLLFDKPLRPTDRLPPNLSMRLIDIQVDDGWLQASLK